jgi:DNA-binding NarL/FixJ family response regulator
VLAEHGDDRRAPLEHALARAGVVVDPQDAVDVVVVVGETEFVVDVERREENTPLLAIVETADRHAVAALLAAGADGIARATDGGELLARAARAVADGFVVVPREAREALQPPILTPRQKQILSLVVLGLTNGDIAQRLFVTESTVKAHLTSIFAKLGVSSRKEAAHVILDPALGLGAGILGLGADHQIQQGYGAPRVSG